MKRDKFDAKFSNLVRERAAWRCEYPTCGKHYPLGNTAGLECSHIWGRRRHSVRWEPDNALALCTGHHRHVSAHPIEHHEIAVEKLGSLRCHALERQANSVKRWKPWEKAELYKKMKSELKRMKILRDEGETGRIEFDLDP